MKYMLITVTTERVIMKHFISSLTMAILLITASATTCFAGAWTQKSGGFYEQVSFNYYYSSNNFDSDGHHKAMPNSGNFKDFNVTNYLEYGLLDRLTLINSLTYKYLKNDSDTYESKGYGIGDVDLGLKYKLLDSDRFGIFSTQMLFKIPGPYDRNDELPLGNGQFDAEIRLLYGRSLYPWIPGYGNVEVGYRWRLEDPSDEIRYLVEFGVDITKTIYTRAKLDGIYCVNNGKSNIDSSGNPTATNNFDLGKLDIALGYKITPNWGTELSYRPDIYGQNTAAGANYSLAVYYKTP